MRYWTTNVRIDKIDHGRTCGVELPDAEFIIKEYLSNIRAPEIVIEVIIQLNQLFYLQLVFRIERMQFLIK